MRFAALLRARAERAAVVAAGALLLAAAPVFEKLPDHPGRWHRWSVETNMLGASGPPKNARDIRAACTHVQAIQAVFARAQALDPPRGSNVLRSCGFFERSFDGRFPVPYDLGMIFKELDRRCPTCPIEEAAEGPAIRVYVNTISPLIPQNARWQDRYLDEPRIFPEPQLATEKVLGGFPLYQGDFSRKWVVITRDGRPPMWKPVSNERALTRLIDALDTLVENRRRISKKREDFEWHVGREVKLLADVRAELDALTPEERARQAWSGCRVTRETLKTLRASMLCSGEPRDARVTRYVEANDEYWHRSFTRTQPQLLIMDLLTTDGEPRRPEYERKRRQAIIESLDWQALRDIVNEQ